MNLERRSAGHDLVGTMLPVAGALESVCEGECGPGVGALGGSLRRGLAVRPGRLVGRAFTLVELLVAVSVLTLIVYVLFSIFDKTQRALRSNAAQVDVMEGGRAVMDLLARELEQMAPPLDSTNTIGFYVGMTAPGYVLDLPGSDPGTFRENVMEEVYFLSPYRYTGGNRTWEATTYRVLSRANMTADGAFMSPTTNAMEGVGWLGRRSLVMDLAKTNSDYMWQASRGTNAADMAAYTKVADGIVHFQVTPLDSQGWPMELEYLRRSETIGVSASTNAYTNTFFSPRSTPYNSVDMWCRGAAAPAALRVELGILEPQAVERWRALPTAQARLRFLTNQAARIHYFQQRIPIRNAPQMMPQS